MKMKIIMISCRKPKIGLLTLASEWFWKTGAQKLYPELPKTVEHDALKIVSILKKEMDVVHTGIIGKKEEVLSAVDKFRKENIDLLVICPLMWTDDEPLFAAIEQLPEIPLVLWCYTPELSLPKKVSMAELLRRSGPVAVKQFSGPLKRINKRFGFVMGVPDNPETIMEIRDWAKVSVVVRELKKAVIGVLPYRCSLMSGTYVDEFRLRTKVGPQLKYISVGEYKKIVDAISDKEIEAYLGKIYKKYTVADITKKSVYQSARVSLGLAKLVNDYKLDALALEDLNEELHRELGVRPCLAVDSLFDRAVVSMEGDIGAATGLLILKKLTDTSPMYVEIFTYDLKENMILAGHPGIHDVRLANGKITITPDYEYAGTAELEGAWMGFQAKPGRVTLLSLVETRDNFHMVTVTGESISCPEKLQGYPHIYIKLDIPLKNFYYNICSVGVTQHFGVVHGNISDKIDKLAGMLNVEILRC